MENQLGFHSVELSMSFFHVLDFKDIASFIDEYDEFHINSLFFPLMIDLRNVAVI